jgi:lactoylglutathione lyase
MQLDHQSIFVEDIEKSVTFYQSVLGMDVLRTTGNPTTGAWVGADGKDIVHLNVGPSAGRAHVKDIHIALRTDRFEQLVAELRAKGVPFENWSGEKSTVNRHAIGFQQIYLQDPDGYWIEINDVEPSRKLTKLY